MPTSPPSSAHASAAPDWFLRRTASPTAAQQAQIMRIWNAEYPNLLSYPSHEAFANYLAQLSDACHLLAQAADGCVMGWLAVFTRDGTRHFMMLVRRDYQHRGVGTQLLTCAKADETALHGWAIDHANDRKSDGTPYRSPLDFYRKNGFVVHPDVRRDADTLFTVKISWTLPTA